MNALLKSLVVDGTTAVLYLDMAYFMVAETLRFLRDTVGAVRSTEYGVRGTEYGVRWRDPWCVARAIIVSEPSRHITGLIYRIL